MALCDFVLGNQSLVAAFAAHAQEASAPSAAAPSSPAKKEYIARILKVRQPGIEAMARNLVEQPAADLMASAGAALPQRVPQERQEAVAKDIRGDIQKYLEDAAPVAQKRAVALAPSTIGAMLDERFTEDELKQIAAMLEAPAFVKFQHMADDMQKALGEKLVADTRPTIEPKLRVLEQSIGNRLGVNPGAPAPAPGPTNGNTGKAPAKQ